MRLPCFEFVAPKTLGEALSFLHEYTAETKLIGGGTDLLPSMKHGLFRPKYLLSLEEIADLARIEFDEKTGLRIGPLVKLRTLEKDPLVAERFPLIRQAVVSIAAPQLRHMGTAGGNLTLNTRCCYYNQSDFWRSCRPACIKMGGQTCNAVGGGKKCFAVYSGDLAPALIVLGAAVNVASSRGTRAFPLRGLYSGDGAHPLLLEPDEMLVSVRVPPPPEGAWAGYFKYRDRKSIDFPMASVAAVLDLDPRDMVFRAARAAMGGVGARPVEVEGLGELLEGKRLDPALLEGAGSLASRQARPVENVLGSSAIQRRRMVQQFLSDALRDAADRRGLGGVRGREPS